MVPFPSPDLIAKESAPGAIVVLGCRVAEGVPSRALAARLDETLRLAKFHPAAPLLLCGGKSWNGVIEAHVMRDWLMNHGVCPQRLICEESSQTTWQNAYFCAQLLRARAIDEIALVTSDFHMKRAQSLFLRQDLRVRPVPAQSSARRLTKWKNWLREWGAARLTPVLVWRR